MADLYCEFALPARSDSIVNAARQIGNEHVDIGDKVSLAVSSLEAPSAVMAVREALHGAEVELSYAMVHSPGTRDPRRAANEGALALWSYEKPGFWPRLRRSLGEHARPAVRPPTAEVASAVARIAGTRYSRSAWSAAAGDAFGDARAIEGLLAVMVHPPGIADLASWDARFSVMVAAALAIGRFAASPLASSPGGDTLLRLLDGPVDWTTTAAAIALVDVALRVPECEEAVIDRLSEGLTDDVTPIWYQCYVEPVLWLLLRLPHLPNALAEVAIDRLAADADT
jgi:hypothetical protein